MLEFLLVLGQVPGTRFTVSFAEVLVAALALDGWFIWRRRLFWRTVYAPYGLIILKTRVTWRLRLLKINQLVRLTRRKAAVPQAHTLRRRSSRTFHLARQAY